MASIPYSRVRDTKWNLNGTEQPGGGVTVATDDAHLAVLMDIREELKTLNRTLACPNFLGIPHTLNRMQSDMRQVNRRLAQTRKLPKGRTKG